MKQRCKWASNKLMIKYHDKEWGVPVHNDRKLFEMLILEGAQAGLSWNIILKKRKNYKKAFNNFNVKKISKYNNKDFERLVNDKGIIRNKLKINATIENAKLFLKIQEEFGSFDKYIWNFIKNKPIVNKFRKTNDLPANTKKSDEISKALKKRGFKFFGSTICYSFMQAIGMVNDHTINCFKYKKLQKIY